MEELKISVKLDAGAVMPVKAHADDAGFDLFTPESCRIEAHGSATVDTGVHMAIPGGYVGFLKSKSGLNVKHGITGEGVIDAGYTGPIVVKLYNDSDSDYVLGKGDKLIQIVILPIPHVTLVPADSLDETERGSNGFGSSGN